MIIPFLKKNRKYSLYDTDFDKKIDKKLFNFTTNDELTNHYKLTNFEFDFIDYFYEGFAIAKEGELTFFIDKSGNKLKTDRQYWNLHNFENGIAAVKHIDCWTFINKNGIELTDKEYNEYSKIHRDFINVRNAHKYHYSFGNEIEIDEFKEGLIDLNGYEIIPPKPKQFISIEDTFIMVESDSYPFRQIFDFNGELIKNKDINKFEYIEPFYDNRKNTIAKVKDSQDYVIIDQDFNIVKKLLEHISFGDSYLFLNPHKFTKIINNLCAVRVKEKWGFINMDGDYVLKPIYDYLEPFLDDSIGKNPTMDFAVVGKILEGKLKYAAINQSFQEITDFIYDEINYFSENVASVRINDKWGAINYLGEIIVPIEFISVNYCYNGCIEVSIGDYDELKRFRGQFGFFDKSGNKICPIIYQNVSRFEFGYSIVKRDDKFGLINLFGKEIVNCIYESMIGNANEGYCVTKNNQKYYIDSSGREFIEK